MKNASPVTTSNVATFANTVTFWMDEPHFTPTKLATIRLTMRLAARPRVARSPSGSPLTTVARFCAQTMPMIAAAPAAIAVELQNTIRNPTRGPKASRRIW